MGFDDLNVMQQIDGLYDSFANNSRKVFCDLFAARYGEVCVSVRGKKPDEDDIYALAEMYILGLLETPNENTHYAYNTEILRKRDKAKEAVVSVPTKTQKQIELSKSIRFVSQQTGFYADFVSQGAEIEAYKDSGVKRVVRHEMKDDKVCAACKAENGKVYDIDKIPPLTHLRCRRWFTPVKGEADG